MSASIEIVPSSMVKGGTSATRHKIRQVWTPEEDRLLSEAVAIGEHTLTVSQAQQGSNKVFHQKPPTTAQLVGTKLLHIYRDATTRIAESGGTTASSTPFGRAPGREKRIRSFAKRLRCMVHVGARSPRLSVHEMETNAGSVGMTVWTHASTRAPGPQTRCVFICE